MPQFPDFDYYFQVDIMELDPSVINLSGIFLGLFVVFVPWMYYKYFAHRGYLFMIAISHIFYVFADAVNILLASRYNLRLGIPDLFLYIISG